jgi:hypothetical protein
MGLADRVGRADGVAGYFSRHGLARQRAAINGVLSVFNHGPFQSSGLPSGGALMDSPQRVHGAALTSRLFRGTRSCGSVTPLVS